MPTMTVDSRRRDATRERARGAGALAALAVLVAGVPWGLAALAGWPLPTSVPSLSGIGDALADGFIPETVLVKALALACWVLWSQLTVSVLVESVAVFRGRQAPDLAVAGPMQRLAARLVAAAALLIALAATREAAADRRPIPPPPAAVATVAAHTPAAVHAPAAAPEPVVHVVERRDTLWGIAEERLGDPFRWRELFELNRDLPQPDGRSLRQPDLIRPGWRILLPADAAPAAATTVSVTVPGGPETMTDESPAPLLAGGEPMVDLGPGPGGQQAGRR